MFWNEQPKLGTALPGLSMGNACLWDACVKISFDDKMKLFSAGCEMWHEGPSRRLPRVGQSKFELISASIYLNAALITTEELSTILSGAETEKLSWKEIVRRGSEREERAERKTNSLMFIYHVGLWDATEAHANGFIVFSWWGGVRKRALLGTNCDTNPSRVRIWRLKTEGRKCRTTRSNPRP